MNPEAKRHYCAKNATRIKFLRRMRDRAEGTGRMNTATLARHGRRKSGKLLREKQAKIDRLYAETGLTRL